MSPSPDPIVEQLRKIRIEKEISQRQLAGMIGTTQSAISEMENGVTGPPNVATLRKIADALGFDLVLVKKEDR